MTNRSIKFRVWDGECIRNSSLYWFEEQGVWNWPEDAPEGHTLMQYTGLLDANGEEICEGDLVRWDWIRTHGVFIVIYERGAFFLKNGGVLNPLHSVVGSTESTMWLRVIGNIYENSELLETKEATT